MPVTAIRPVVAPVTCFPFVRVEAMSNDPKLRAKVEGLDRIRITGTATNNGIVASLLAVTVDGKRVSVPLSRGTTPLQAFRALEKALPTGYSATLQSAERRPGGEVVVQIARQSRPVVKDVSKIPTSITANGADARVEAYLWANLMPGPLPRSKPILASVTVSGTGFNDAPPNFKVGSFKVYEEGTGKLLATIADPKLVESNTRWGQKSDTFRLELPSNLDLNKKYTFVASTGINGSKPAQVRSEYVPVHRVY
ncbi:MAG: hypothetical protein HYZ28_29025 [Myxococcales bacterium]|nr:hypothetical protein [Myxococcales bacterium]